MKRRSFLTSSVGTALGSIAVTTANADESRTPDRKLMLTPAVLMAPRADGMEIIWAVSRLSRGWIEYREEGGEVQRADKDTYGFFPQSDKVMKIRVDGLKAGTRYAWRAITQAIDGEKTTEESPWKIFRTLDPEAASSAFVVWNDTHQHDDTIKILHEKTPKADFMVWNGDTCNDWHREELLAPTLLSPAGLDITDGRPLCLTMGNHDVRGKFGFKIDEYTAAPENLPYYAFRSGPLAVICLNTGEDKPDDHPSFAGRVAFRKLREEQAQWLREIIARPEFKNAPQKVVFCHIPLRGLEEPEVVDYAGGQWDRYARSSRDLWHDALVEWGTQVVISGHTHRPTWIPANEKFPYAQLIGGGPRSENARWIEGKADAGGLKIAVRNLAGEVTEEVEFPRLG